MRKLGIIAGSGRMPALLVESCQTNERPYFVLGLEGHTDDALLADVPHKIVRLGAVGEALKTLKKEGVQEVIMAGSVGRPSLSSLRPDMTATMLIAKYGTGIFSGDDALLSAIVKIMEGEGFDVVGIEEVLSHLLAKKGTLGKTRPSRQQQEDIARGMIAAKALGAADIGQSVIVENGYVLGVEAAEGTDELIRRCATYKQHTKGEGVLVKAKKPAQDARADLPTIGIDTVEQAHLAGFAGIAVEAASSIILDEKEVIKLADKHGIFIVGTVHG